MLFSELMVPEFYQGFWQVLSDGGFITDAAAVAGTYRGKGRKWIRQVGGVRPRRGRNLQGRYLSFAEREEIALGRAAGESMRSIAKRLGRSASTICRELCRNAELGGGYRATSAHGFAYERAGRPKRSVAAGPVSLRMRGPRRSPTRRHPPRGVRRAADRWIATRPLWIPACSRRV